MSAQVIYKNINWKEESTWGVSSNLNLKTLQIITSTIKDNPNKSEVMDTATSLKGHDRIVRLKNEIEGDINAYGSPKILHNFLKMINGGAGTTAASGTSAVLTTYNQSTDGNPLSTTIIQDRNNTQEAFYGLRGQKLILKAQEGIVDATLTMMGKTRGTGPSVTDIVGETFKPFVFADATISVGLPGFTQTMVVNVSDWQIEYDTGLERTHLSGTRDAARLDFKIPTIKGNFKIFHTGLSLVAPTFGSSELYLRFELTGDGSEGLISGVTPVYARIDIPRVELSTNERNYEQNKLSVETVSFIGVFDPGTSTLWKPQMTTGFDIET